MLNGTTFEQSGTVSPTRVLGVECSIAVQVPVQKLRARDRTMWFPCGTGIAMGTSIPLVIGMMLSMGRTGVIVDVVDLGLDNLLAPLCAPG